MPRSAEQNRALRDASRERLLGAAMRLFSRHGYSATPIRKIAEEAGVAQGLLYSHFHGKEDLLKALFRRCMEDVRESFAAAAKDVATDPRSPLERLVASALAILKRNLDFWRLSYGMRMQEEVVEVLGPDLKAWTRDILDTLEAHFRATAVAEEAGRKSTAAAEAAGRKSTGAAEAAGRRSAGTAGASVQAALFFAAFDGICQHFVLDPENYPLEAVSRGLLERFAPPPIQPKGDIHGKHRRR